MLQPSARTLVLGAALLLALTPACRKKVLAAKDAKEIKVAAAADLAHAFKEVGAAFTEKTGNKVTFTFGSTGQLAKQISQGAPYDVFAAANVSFIDEVIDAGVCDASTKAQYARGRIVAWSKNGVVEPAKTLADLADPRFVKIAIANPEHAPYGKAARQALEAAGVYDTVKTRLVYGENVLQTLQFAQTGNAEVALVALSLAVVSEGGTTLPIDESLHRPLDQALVVCGKGATDTAAAFAAFVNSDEGRVIMRRYGFLLPGETVAQVP